MSSCQRAGPQRNHKRARGSDGFSPGKDGPSREAVGVLLDRVELHPRRMGQGVCLAEGQRRTEKESRYGENKAGF